MPEAIFDQTDKPRSSTLPPELAGKTPEEIAAYYQRRESILIERARTAQPPQPPAPKPEDDKIDLFGDPSGSINRVVERKVNSAADQFAGVVSPAIINACKITLRDAHADAQKYMPEIEAAMAKMSGVNQMNPDYWEVAYTNVKGRHADDIARDAVAADRQARNPVEKPTPPGTPPAKPKELSGEERTIAVKFGMDDKQYRDAADRYETTDGRIPITVDNRKTRKKAR